MMSIMKAEEKLKQNDQNVEIFEELRNSIMSKKRKAPTNNINKTESKISSSDANLIQEIPDISKYLLIKLNLRPRPFIETSIRSLKRRKNRNPKKIALRPAKVIKKFRNNLKSLRKN